MPKSIRAAIRLAEAIGEERLHASRLAAVRERVANASGLAAFRPQYQRGQQDRQHNENRYDVVSPSHPAIRCYFTVRCKQKTIKNCIWFKSHTNDRVGSNSE